MIESIRQLIRFLKLASRFPGILLRLPEPLVEGYVQLALLGLGAQERFSLKSAADFLVYSLTEFLLHESYNDMYSRSPSLPPHVSRLHYSLSLTCC